MVAMAGTAMGIINGLLTAGTQYLFRMSVWTAPARKDTNSEASAMDAEGCSKDCFVL